MITCSRRTLLAALCPAMLAGCSQSKPGEAALTDNPAPTRRAAQQGASATRQPGLIPRLVFFGNPDRANVQVSPDGTRISYLAPLEGVMNVWVQTIGSDDARAVTSTTQRPIRSYFWAQNSQQIIYRQDRAGDENFHLYAVDLSSQGEIDLTPFEGVQARLVASDQNFEDEILVGVNQRRPDLHDVLKVNTLTGQSSLVFQNDAGYAAVGADSRFEVRLASKLLPSGALQAMVRAGNDAPWEELATWSLEDAATSGPLGFSRDGQTLYVQDSRAVNTGRLYAYHIDGPDGPTYDQVAADEHADLREVIFDPKTGQPQAAAFEYARLRWVVLDPAFRSDWDQLRRVARGEMTLLSRDRADKKWIVAYLVDDGPVSFYLYDRAQHKASLLFTNRRQLEGLKLATMEPVTIAARDGLDLVGYLTRPPGVQAMNLPMVLLVHGGPWARDSWGYNPIHQWLANRGYAVLSVNFRGSTGLGKQFLNAGNREWSGRMHQDLVDAVNWAVSEGVADPDRVAIMGGSYGGYATLVGLTFTPEFFAAGVDIVGPSHIRTLLESIPPYWKPIRAMFEQRVARLDEQEMLDRISPLTRVNEIRRPLLIGQGRNDPRVKEVESQQIVSAMQAKGLPVTYVVFPDEGHGFARPENNLAFFAITEAFLAQHLGGAYEPIGGAVKASSAQIAAGAELIPGLVEPPTAPEESPTLPPAMPEEIPSSPPITPEEPSQAPPEVDLVAPE